MAYYDPFYNQNNNKKNSDDDRREPGAVALFLIIIIFIALFAFAAFFAYNIVESQETPVVGTGYYYDISDADGGDVMARENIKVFSNNSFNEDIIAPGAKGEYTFNFINSGDNAISYSIEFSCVNEYNINIVYKLMQGDSYICGSAEEYVSISELALATRTIKANKAETFTLYWYWAHNDAVDTVAGINSAEYTLTFAVNTKEAA